MMYRTVNPILVKGDRVNRGVEIELSEAEAANLGDDVALVGEAVVVEEEVVEAVPLEDMNHAQLKDKADELGLKKSGSMADLQERITLHLTGEAEALPEEDNQD